MPLVHVWVWRFSFLCVKNHSYTSPFPVFLVCCQKKGGYFLTGAKFEHVPLCLGPKKPSIWIKRRYVHKTPWNVVERFSQKNGFAMKITFILLKIKRYFLWHLFSEWPATTTKTLPLLEIFISILLYWSFKMNLRREMKISSCNNNYSNRLTNGWVLLFWKRKSSTFDTKSRKYILWWDN